MLFFFFFFNGSGSCDNGCDGYGRNRVIRVYKYMDQVNGCRCLRFKDREAFQ